MIASCIRRLPALLLAIVSFGVNQTRAEARPELHAASVLFGQFETVFYAKADFLSNSGAYEHVAKNDAYSLRFPFGLLEEGLKFLGPNTSQEILSSSEAVLVGAKDFLAPSGLGPVRSQRCYVVILKRNEFDLHKYLRQSPAASVAGAPVWNWSAKLGEFGEEDPSRPSSYYAAQIAGSYLLVSNNLEELQAAAKGLSSSDTSETALSGIRDWELVRQHKVWGYRRYRHSGVIDRTAAGMSIVTPSVEALAFFVDFDKQVSLMRLLCADDATVAKINATAKLPPLKSQAKGMWETRIPLTGNEESFDRLFGVMYLFGFGVYL